MGNIQELLPQEPLESICQRWRIHRLEVFGSAIRDDFRVDSDIDLLVDFEPGSRPSIHDWDKLEADFSSLSGRRVDVLSRRAIEMSRNWVLKREILGSARVLYEAG